MRRDKDFIFDLRKQGKSYRDIQKITGVSRGTLCDWFKNETWSTHLTREHSENVVRVSKERMIRMNMVRTLKLQYQYALAESEAEKEYQTYKNDPLFWAGLMVYAGEGDKRSKHQIRVSNSEFYLHRIFISFCCTYLKVPFDQFKVGLLLYPDLSEETCLSVWSKELDVQNKNFYKVHFLEGKHRVNRLQYGIGISIISSTSLKKKLLKWLELSKEESFNAVIV